MKTSTLSPTSFGLAGGIILALTLFGAVWHAILADMGYEFLRVWEDMHFWYEVVPLATPLGSVVSLVDGFVHGFVYLFLLIWIYNLIEKRRHRNVEN